MKKTTIFGLVITCIWFFFVVFLLLQASADKNFFTLDLNAKGDFLAGVFAPVAFLWLVLGYFQQGKELKLNTEALLLQQQELKQQVIATQEIGSQSARQASVSEKMHQFNLEEYHRMEVNRIAERKSEIKPDLHVTFHSEKKGIITLLIANYGGEARLLEAKSNFFEGTAFIGDPTRVRFEYKLSLNLIGFRSDAVPGIFVTVTCKDIDNNSHEFNFNRKSATEISPAL